MAAVNPDPVRASLAEALGPDAIEDRRVGVAAAVEGAAKAGPGSSLAEDWPAPQMSSGGIRYHRV